MTALALNADSTEASGQVSLPALQAIVWRRRWQVLGVTLFAIGLGGLFLAVVEPTFDVQARLLVERQGMPLQEAAGDPRGDKEFVATQAEVIRSPAVVKRAVESHGVTVADGLDVDPVVAILAELRVSPVLGTHVLSVKYTTPDPQQGRRALRGIIDSYHAYLREHEEDAQLEAVRLLTRSEKELRDDLTQREKQYLELREKSPLLGGQGRDAVALQIEPLTRLGETLQAITNRRLELSNLLTVMQKANGTAAAGAGSEVQFVALKVPADEPDATLTTAGVADVTRPSTGLIHSFTQQTATPHELVSIQQELSRARSSAQQLSTQYGHKHPAVQAARAQVAAWEDRLHEYLESAPVMFRQELEAIERQEKQLQELYQSELAKAKAVDSYVIREQQALDGITRVQTMHSSLLAQLQQWQLSEQALADGRSRVTFRVLEEPIVPEEATWPAPKLVLAVSVILGLCAGIGLALFLGPDEGTIPGEVSHRCAD